jgi:hypothetical protein
MIQKLPYQAQKFPNKICNCRELNKNNFPYWNFSKFRMEFELKIREPICAKFD